MLYCLDHLEDVSGAARPMLGLMPGRAAMQPRLAALGLQEIAITGSKLRGHTFHFSRLETSLAPIAYARNPDGGRGEGLFRQGSLWASYVHGYFASAPFAIATMLSPLLADV
jgi:cobyrinic acid a,c-diamide synthase